MLSRSQRKEKFPKLILQLKAGVYKNNSVGISRALNTKENIFLYLTLEVNIPPNYGSVFPGGSDGKESACHGRRPRFDPWVRKMPWRREWLPTPIFLPRKFRGQGGLVGYSPRGHQE